MLYINSNWLFGRSATIGCHLNSFLFFFRFHFYNQGIDGLGNIDTLRFAEAQEYEESRQSQRGMEPPIGLRERTGLDKDQRKSEASTGFKELDALDIDKGKWYYQSARKSG